MHVGNLNNMTVEDHDGLDRGDLKENSIRSTADVEVVFRNLESRLVKFISECEVVVGCVAWLTSEPILNALAKVPQGVAVIVQKEDFLRPDVGSHGQWPKKLRAFYDKLRQPFDRHNFPNVVSFLSMGGDPSLHPVRCVGNNNSEKVPAHPRMHNKFIVGCKVNKIQSCDDWEDERIEPIAVWTGSFNFTKNAALSLENALIIRDEKVARAYFDEWGQITMLSERLDWTSEWCVPEWRVGT
jgi:hypothetical protein